MLPDADSGGADSLPNYGKNDPEPDWYAQDRSNVGVAQDEAADEVLSIYDTKKSKLTSFYEGFKKKTSWYLWNRYKNKYDTYEDFKRSEVYNSSISSDFRKLLEVFKKK